MAQARDIAERMVIDAEKYKAALDKPPGNNDIHETAGPNANVINAGNLRDIEDTNNPQQFVPTTGALNIDIQQLPQPNTSVPREACDDSFFHITCHIDPSLKTKIEKGGFVDLKKLLPREGNRKIMDENKMELVHSEGSMYFVSASDRDKRINSVCRWELAFRVYAAIYSRANPHRSAEIWQYVYVINLAAASYSWDNVSSYDYTFRQLMAEYPDRSWALIYNQMWNLAMRDPVGGKNFAVKGTKDGRTKRDDYCWHFNKNRCKFGSRCRYEHRCFYCDGFGHGVFNCGQKSEGNNRRRSDDRHHDRCRSRSKSPFARKKDNE